MKSKFEDIIRNKIDSPEIEPKNDIWGAIENDLIESEFKSSLLEKLNEIEIAQPSNRVWNTIESSLHKEPAFRFQPYRNWFIAASLLLVLGTWLLLSNYSETVSTVSPIVEMAKPKDAVPSNTTQPSAPEINELVADKGTNNRVALSSREETKPAIHSPEVLPAEDPAIATLNSNADSSGATILEELQFAHLPDSLLTPLIPQELIPIRLPIEITQVPVQKMKERLGSETAVNYFLSKILGLPKANVAIEQRAKGDKNVWKVNFDSRLLSFSGNLPSGKNAE